MATLTLTAAFINLLSSGASVTGQSAPGRGESYEYAGTVQTYAGGRQRAIASVGEKGTYTLQVMLLSRANVDTLRSWAGLTVQVRDNKGRRFFGVFNKIVVVEPAISEFTWHVDLVINVVTVNEGV